MVAELGTTNLFLGIMAAVSLLEGVLIVGGGIAGFMAYRRVVALLNGIETRQVAPAMAQVNAILGDVKTVTAMVKEEAVRVDNAFNATLDGIDDAAGRVRSHVRARTRAAIGFVRGLRVAIEWMRRSRHRTHET